MKKVISLLLTVIMVLCMFTVPVMAADPAEVTAKAIYTTKVIDVVYKNTAEYDCYVTIYMVDADDYYYDDVFEDFNQPGTILRMAVAQANANGEAKVTFDFGSDIKTGDYKFFAAPSGENGSEYYAATNAVTIIGETADEGNDTIDSVLDYINEGDDTNSSSRVVQKLEKALDLSDPSWRDPFIYEIRVDDFNGKFETITEVEKAIKMAEAIYAIRRASSSRLENVIVQNKDILGIDVENPDYIEYKSIILPLYSDKIVDVKSKSENDNVLNELIGLSVIQNGDTSEIAAGIKKYYKALGISEDLYKLIEEEGAEVIARNFDEDFEATTKEDVVTEILEVLAEIENESPNETEDVDDEDDRGSNRGPGITIPNQFATQTTTPAYTTTFADVPSTHWANAPVEHLAKLGVLSGKGDGKFAPDNTVTREEFVKMIVAAFKYTNVGDGIEFADVAKSDWAYDYIKIAYENNIVKGLSGDRFGIGSPITRQDMAVIIMRVVNDKGILLSGNANSFADDAEIAGYAKESVKELVAGGILNGYNDGTFRPEGSLTRAEAAKVIYALINR